MSVSLQPHELQHTRPPCLLPNFQPSHPLSSPSPPAPTSSHIRVFSNESALCMRWPKYWSFSFSISPSKEHPGLISFGMDWLDLFAVQGTLKSLLQHCLTKSLSPTLMRVPTFRNLQCLSWKSSDLKSKGLGWVPQRSDPSLYLVLPF